MKATVLFLLLLSSVFFMHCASDDIQLSQQRVTGVIGGAEWDYKFSNAFLFSTDQKYQIKIMSDKEPGQDPCTVPSPGNPFISVVIPLVPQSYSLPLPNIQESARFHISGGNTQIAAGGFLEIFAIDNLRVFGYIQAQLDDDNTVEGSFEAVICN